MLPQTRALLELPGACHAASTAAAGWTIGPARAQPPSAAAAPGPTRAPTKQLNAPGKHIAGAVFGCLATLLVSYVLGGRGGGGGGPPAAVTLGGDRVLRRQFSSSSGGPGSATGDPGWVMPMVPIGNLSTAALLDANPGLTGAETRALVQLHQQLFCR